MAADFTVRGDTKLDGSGFSEGLSRMGNLAAKGLKVVGASLAAASVAVGALAKQSLDAYSDYEQMVGGVKTLFGTEAASVEEYAASVGKSVGEVRGEYDALVAAQNKVFADAKNAYKDAGMSANAYMQTVTSFSARLLQGLGGDSQKAAEIANMAVVDMSDNVNKMGSSMTDVQNAYQGFAKQNYTMLDNLKLGYGGTQAEMARLINDSGVLGDTMTVTAETVNNVSFDKIIEAIHTIQTEMGITGTTAKEASTTIAGSVSQMSAAWTNWLTALADPSQDLSQLTTALLDSIVNVGKNVVPRLMEILPALGSGLVSLASGLVGYIPGAVQQLFPALVSGATSLLQGLAGMLPGLITSAFSALPDVFSTLFAAAPGLASAGMQIVQTLGNAITQYGPTLMQNGLAMIQQLGQGLVQGIPAFLTQAASLLSQFSSAIMSGLDAIVPVGAEFLRNLGEGLKQGIPTFLQQALPMLVQFTSNLRANFGTIVDAGIDLILSLAQGFISALPTLLAYVPQVVSNIAGLINDNVPKLLLAGARLILMLAQGIVQAIPSLVANLPQIIQAIVDVFTAFNWLSLGKNIITLLKNGMTSMIGAVKTAGQGVVDSVKSAITNLPATLQGIGSNAVQSLVGGIRALTSSAQTAGAGVFSAVRTAIASLPSTLLSLGKNAITGLANGIRGLAGSVGSAASGILRAIVNAITGLPGKLFSLAKSAISRMVSAFTSQNWASIGSNIIRGIISGIGSAVGGLVDAAVNAAKSAFNGAKKALGIHSPSRLFRDEVGKMIPAGMAVGVTKYTDPALRSVQDMAQRMVQAGQAATAQMQARTASGYARASSGSASVETAPVTQSHTQNIYFEQPMQAPDEIARALRIQNTYGLAGAR